MEEKTDFVVFDVKTGRLFFSKLVFHIQKTNQYPSCL